MIKPNTPKSRRGITLMEILVVVVILSVLGALMLPTIGKMRAAGANTGCISNLHQIGVAINLYCGDHDGYLPGPAWGPLYYYYYPLDSGADKTLTVYLAPYLGGQTSVNTLSQSPIVVCPGFRYKSTLPSGLWSSVYSYATTYYMTYMQNGVSKALTVNGRLVNPWGRSTSTDVNNGPSRLVTIQSLYDPSQVWAIREMDATVNGANTGVSPKPTHVGHWNRLYFDFHVAPTTDSLP